MSWLLGGGNISKEFYLDVVQGKISGHSVTGIQGVNNNVSSSARENLWCSGGMMVYPTAGEQWEVVSDNAADTSAGTGLQTATLIYLDDLYDLRVEVITMNGVTPVPTAATNCFRFIALVAATVGADRWNMGQIHLAIAGTGGGAGNDRGCVLPEGNLSLHGFYTVPKGKSAYVIWGSADVGKGKDCNVSFMLSSGGNTPFLEIPWARLYQSSEIISPIAPIAPSALFTPTGAMPEKSEIMFGVTSANPGASVKILLQILLVDNDL